MSKKRKDKQFMEAIEETINLCREESQITEEFYRMIEFIHDHIVKKEAILSAASEMKRLSDYCLTLSLQMRNYAYADDSEGVRTACDLLETFKKSTIECKKNLDILISEDKDFQTFDDVGSFLIINKSAEKDNNG